MERRGLLQNWVGRQAEPSGDEWRARNLRRRTHHGDRASADSHCVRRGAPAAAVSLGVTPRHIFFYGTLMRGFALRERACIEPWLGFVGGGSVRGALFDLGPYPALVAGAGIVRGEVYACLDAARLLPRVDALEHYDPDSPRTGEYRRERMPARLDDGRTLAVWAYVYNRPLGAARSLPGGDYRRAGTGRGPDRATLL